ncbi:MAG: hypothetical protein IKR66_05185, partial [Bacteroidales bacterium]|nr:hypothetical protein [Bacteroidales bacterium]
DGDFTLKYEFTNATTHCSNSATKDFHVEYVEVPTPINHTGIITDPKIVQVSVSDIEQGAEYHWYAGQSSTDVLSSDIPYATDDNPETEVEKSYWVSKSVSGCESGRAEATVTIVNCPWTAPIAENAGVCQYAESKEMTASVPSGVTPIEWHWYDSQKNLIANTQNYTQESTNVDGKTTYYVAYTAMETISGTVCESAPAIVTTQVYRLPIVSFNNLPHVVCYLESEFEIDVKTNYVESNGSGSGVWQITGNSDALSQAGIFSPKVNGSVSDTYTVTYTYTDGKSCSNSVNSTIEVVYLPQPTTENHFSLTSQNIDAEVSSDYVATAQSVHWYDADGRELNSSVVNATGKISWKTGDKGNEVVNKNYYVAQEESGCYSEKSVVNVKIIDCPVPAPITVGAEMCDYDDVPELTASIGEWTDGIRPSGNAEIFRFYDAEGNKLDENTTGVFVPTIDHSTARNYDFYITEWNTNVTPTACESPKAKVSLVVKKPQSASVVVSQESVCEAPEGMNPEMLIVGYSGAGNPLWFEDNPNYPICDAPIRGAGNSFIPSVSTVGENSVWMMIFEDNCYSEPTKLSFTIKPIPEPPTVTESSICEGQNSVALTATPDADGFVSWYLNPSRSRASLLKTNSSTYVPIEKNRGTYTFYATQTVDGCQSATRNVTYTIKPNPGIPTILYNTYNICEYDNPPLLNAIGTDVKWYLSDKTTLANVENDGIGNLYQVEDMTIGKHTFYASQTVEGCESQLADITYYVNKKPATPITTSKTMCEGDEVIPTLLTNLATDTWYADEYATAMIFQGTEYTPESVGSENLTYYVMREQNGCHSDTATVTLFVIKQPTFEIDSSMLLRCFSDPIVELHAVNLDEDYHDNTLIDGVVRWYFNKKTTEGDSYIPDSADLKIGNNTIYAQYFVTREGATCVSKQQSMTYDVHTNPKPPILGNLPICIGEYLNSKESAGVPIYTEMGCSVIWSSPNIDNGAIHESRMVTISSNTMESFGVGYIPVKATAVDSKVSTCFTEITDSIKISGMPDATIVGNDHLCEGTIGEEYYVQNVSKNTRYNWSITGENQIYTKSDNYQNIRYIDWNHATVDTIAVTVTSEDFCIASDTMVVFVAPKPVASYTWELPGASNVIELTNATMQDSLWYINDLGDSVAIEIPYNMYWNYGHQGEEASQIDEEVEYKYRFSSIKEEGYVYGYNCPILTVENSYGCQSTYRECIFVNISTSLFVPSAFSPSNPAHGVRTFQPKGFNLKECEISVYDKWGNLLWYSNEVSDGMFVGSWDGTCNGKMMASDVYIWKMEATFLDGQTWDGFDVGNGKKSKFGSVTLVR